MALVAIWLWPAPSAAPGLEASNQARAAQRRAQGEAEQPSDLDVRIEDLSATPPRAGAVEREPVPVPPETGAAATDAVG